MIRIKGNAHTEQNENTVNEDELMEELVAAEAAAAEADNRLQDVRRRIRDYLQSSEQSSIERIEGDKRFTATLVQRNTSKVDEKTLQERLGEDWDKVTVRKFQQKKLEEYLDTLDYDDAIGLMAGIIEPVQSSHIRYSVGVAKDNDGGDE